MQRNFKLEKLQAGEVIITSEKGNSMSPLIESNQLHKLTPVSSWEEVQVDDIVYCRVHGHYYTHLVHAINENKGCLIGNNKGHINGWTKAVYAKVTNVY